jgi:hypothetical protein
MRRILAWAAVALTAAVPASAQSLANRISAVRDGIVRISFEARPGVCGDGRGSVWIQDADKRGSSGSGQWVCIGGPVRVAIGRADNQTVSVRKWVGGAWNPTASATDLGMVPSDEAAKYLVTVARMLGGGNADEALSAASFAANADISPELRAIVRDDDASLHARKQALFWLGQSDDFSSRDLAGLYETLKPFQLREHYTFVLSQRRDDDALSKLIEVARTDRDLEIRKRAMFWIGQSRDPKAKQFLRDIIVR